MYPKSADIAYFSKGLKDEFKTAVVSEPSVFEPLKFCCSYAQQCLYRDPEKTVLAHPSRWLTNEFLV